MITDLGLAAKQTPYKESIQNWENLIFIFFDPLLNRYYIKQNTVATSEFIITRAHCTKEIFLGNMSAIANIYGCVISELWIADSSGFKKDLVSFTIKNIHPFNVSLIETDLLLSKLASHKLC